MIGALLAQPVLTFSFFFRWTTCFIASGDFLLSEDDQKKGYVHAAKQGYVSSLNSCASWGNIFAASLSHYFFNSTHSREAGMKSTGIKVLSFH